MMGNLVGENVGLNLFGENTNKWGWVIFDVRLAKRQIHP